MECCSKPETMCTAESKPNFPNPYIPFIETGGVILIIGGLYFVSRWINRKLVMGIKKSIGIARATLVVQAVCLLGALLWGAFLYYEGYWIDDNEFVAFLFVAVVAWFGPLVAVRVGYWIRDGFNEDKSK